MRLRKMHAVVLGAGLALPGLVQAGDCVECGDGSGGKLKKCKVDNCAVIPKGAQPAPAGTYINRFIQVQDNKAEMDDFVIYKHMWYRGGTTLGPLGRYQLDLIAQRLPTVPFPVVVATSKDATLDETRREAVAAYLRMKGFGDATRVVVAYPIAEGLYGDEAPRILAEYLVGWGWWGGAWNNVGFGPVGGIGGFGRLPYGGFNSFRGFGGFAGVGRP